MLRHDDKRKLKKKTKNQRLQSTSEIKIAKTYQKKNDETQNNKNTK